MQELVFGLIGGTALLMYGVDKMGDALEKASGDVMKKILTVLTGRVWSALIVGTLVTAVVQSSTAVTLLTVGFVNAGLMKLPQAIGVIYGANIGTTITAQLMAFSFHFKLTDIALPVLGVGFAVSHFGRRRIRHLGDAIMGFGVMFLGLKILNGGVSFMQGSPALKVFFERYASIPVVAVLMGAGATALVHSSSATVGLVMILGKAGLIGLQAAVCIMLGDNIGTCITAQMASLTGNLNARRTAWAHTLFNIIGVVIAGIFLPVFLRVISAATQTLQPGAGIEAEIANSHTLFNVMNAAIFLPFTRQYVKFLESLVRGTDERPDSGLVFLDRLLLDTPPAAMKAVASEMARVMDIARRMLRLVMEAFHEDDERKIDSAVKSEETLNTLQRQITMYIVDLSKRGLSDIQSAAVPAMISGINNIERVGDHALSLANLGREKIEGKLVFTDQAMDELREIERRIWTMFSLTIDSLKSLDGKNIDAVRDLEQQLDDLSSASQDGHARRLEEGLCTVESGLIFLDVINYLERTADHVYKACEAANQIANAADPGR